MIKNTGWQPTEPITTQPPSPPTSGSNAVKPNPTVYVMRREELDEWVKTKARIGDVAYNYDRTLERGHMYCYRKLDDHPFWRMIDPKFIPDDVKKESKGDNKMNITGICPYETPCGWCTKWDKKCDKKIGHDAPPLQLSESEAQRIMDYIKAGKLPSLKEENTCGLERIKYDT